jgi:putative aminopeptidase FrvX
VRILRQLSEAIGVSGAEGEVRRLIIDMISPHVDELQTDVLGSVIAFKRGTASRGRLKVMVDAHMDEVGLMVMDHEKDGMLRVASIGGFDPRVLPGKRVLVGPKKLPGVIGVRPIHLLRREDENKPIDLKDLRVDIGVDSKEAASKKAKIGDRICFPAEWKDLGQVVRGKAFDDRVGCAVLVHLVQGERFPFDLYAAFTVQEEVGLRGAQAAANRIAPDIGIAFEGTIADDLPKEDDVSPTTELGKGPAISLMDRSAVCDRRLNRLLTETAEELGIAYQFKQPGIGGTDAGAINRALGGVPVTALSVPTRYVHSPLAIVHKRDYRNTVTLAQAALSRLTNRVLSGEPS